MQKVGLMHIEVIHFPVEFLNSVYAEFQTTGAEGFERLCLLAGKKTGNKFTVTKILYPKQSLTKGPKGLSFYVDGDELERIWNWLYEEGLVLIGQIHSHPSEAYHSEADDEMAIITTFGGVSIVVPDFGNSDHMLQGSAFYRLLPGKGWSELNKKDIKNLIKYIP